MSTTTITLRIDSAEKQLISDYARTFGVSVSEFVRETTLRRIEDELDLVAWKQAKAEFEADPQMVPAADVTSEYL